MLPWFAIASVGDPVAKAGVDGDGSVTLLLGLLAGLLAVARWGRVAKVTVLLLGAAVGLVGAMYVADPLLGADLTASQLRVAEDSVSVEVGLYATVLAGALTAGGPLVDATTG